MSGTDFSPLREFVVEIESATRETMINVAKAVGISAGKGKRAWAKAASGSRHLKAYPHSITYDAVETGPVISTELGPELGRSQGALGIIEDAPGGVRGGAQRNYRDAERAIEEDLPVGIAKAIDQAWRG